MSNLAFGWLFFVIVAAVALVVGIITFVVLRDEDVLEQRWVTVKGVGAGAIITAALLASIAGFGDIGIGEEKLTVVSTTEYESVSGAPTIAQESWLVSTGKYTVSIGVLNDDGALETISCDSEHTTVLRGDTNTATITTIERTHPNPVLVSMGVITYDRCEFTVSDDWADDFYTKVAPIAP